MTIPNEPCKDCKSRTVGCHSTCEKYEQFKKEMEEYNNTIKHNHSYDFRYGKGDNMEGKD